MNDVSSNDYVGWDKFGKRRRSMSLLCRAEQKPLALQGGGSLDHADGSLSFFSRPLLKNFTGVEHELAERC